MHAGISVVRPEARIHEIGRAIEQSVAPYGYSVVREFIGHGIGDQFHTSLQIPHYYDPRNDGVLLEGMTFTIEPMINLGTNRLEMWDDGWTVATRDLQRTAQFEHTILVTADGFELLTVPADGVPAEARPRFSAWPTRGAGTVHPATAGGRLLATRPSIAASIGASPHPRPPRQTTGGTPRRFDRTRTPHGRVGRRHRAAPGDGCAAVSDVGWHRTAVGHRPHPSRQPGDEHRRLRLASAVRSRWGAGPPISSGCPCPCRPGRRALALLVAGAVAVVVAGAMVRAASERRTVPGCQRAEVMVAVMTRSAPPVASTTPTMHTWIELAPQHWCPTDALRDRLPDRRRLAAAVVDGEVLVDLRLADGAPGELSQGWRRARSRSSSPSETAPNVAPGADRIDLVAPADVAGVDPTGIAPMPRSRSWRPTPG